MATIVNPLNLYGPYIPPTFESIPQGGGGSSDVDKKEVEEMIKAAQANAVFIAPVNNNNSDPVVNP